ncbi:cupredoxin domain-containing protein [Candidatus Nomurabacteria bacterium]|nr:cupredoxin domain-containing protein [Candidatus Nomurabacteria bacterium]
MNKKIIVSIVIMFVLIGGALLLTKNNPSNISEQSLNVNNISVVDGKQIIDISVRGGYSPAKTTAKAGIPTVIRFNTSSTFDCSSFIRIPSMNFAKVLPNTGKTEVQIDDPKDGILQGMCGMGMYRFEINFIN